MLEKYTRDINMNGSMNHKSSQPSNVSNFVSRWHTFSYYIE